MKKINALIAVATVMAVVAVNAPIAYATNVTSSELEELKEDKEAVEGEVSELTKQIKTISAEMLEAQEQITEIYDMIKETDIELSIAEVEKENQYDDMKTRIKYIYENGSQSSLISILFSVTSLQDLLNKVEYASQISNYDREKLNEFQSTVLEIKEKEELLKRENERLKLLQLELTKKKMEVEKLLKKAELSIEELDEEISAVTDALIKAAEEEERKKLEAAQGAVSGTAGDSLIWGNGTFAHPIPGYSYLSSPYGYRYHPISGNYTLHKGTDFAAAVGTKVYAAMEGTVTISQYSSSAGNYISINHGDGLVTIYMHNSALYVSAGDTVTKGQNIAAAGSTGNSTGSHLHFQVMLNGTAVDPMNYL